MVRYNPVQSSMPILEDEKEEEWRLNQPNKTTYLLCSSSFAMMFWLWSAALTSFATWVLAFSRFSVMQQSVINQTNLKNLGPAEADVTEYCSLVSVPLRSLLKSCSLLTSATSLLLSVCSKFSLLLLASLSVSQASEIRWISCSNCNGRTRGRGKIQEGWKRGRKEKRRNFGLTYLTC